ncbi:MAG: hypothetical protein ACFFFK_03630 [Candidatus Thorarchaeota archaeon]
MIPMSNQPITPFVANAIPAAVFIALLMIYIISRNEWKRAGPTRKQYGYMVLTLLLSLIPFIALLPLLDWLAFLFPFVTLYSLLFIIAIGTRKREASPV